MQSRNRKGQFDRKSESDRKVRSIRVTDEAWEKFGDMASPQGITRADLLEKMINSSEDLNKNDEAVKILQEALKLKANAGGAIKKNIRHALVYLGFDGL